MFAVVPSGKPDTTLLSERDKTVRPCACASVFFNNFFYRNSVSVFFFYIPSLTDFSELEMRVRDFMTTTTNAYV